MKTAWLEDRATLRSDPSARPGGVRQKPGCACRIPAREPFCPHLKKAINLKPFARHRPDSHENGPLWSEGDRYRKKFSQCVSKLLTHSGPPKQCDATCASCGVLVAEA